jgi:hypothetical protein
MEQNADKPAVKESLTAAPPVAPTAPDAANDTLAPESNIAPGAMMVSSNDAGGDAATVARLNKIMADMPGDTLEERVERMLRHTADQCYGKAGGDAERRDKMMEEARKNIGELEAVVNRLKNLFGLTASELLRAIATFERQQEAALKAETPASDGEVR